MEAQPSGDAIAGVAIATLLIPESIGYTGVAGVPAQLGLCAAIAAVAAYAVTGGVSGEEIDADQELFASGAVNVRGDRCVLQSADPRRIKRLWDGIGSISSPGSRHLCSSSSGRRCLP